MPYLKGYAHDIFVSDAHGPNTTFGQDPVGQRSRQVVREVARLVPARLGSKERAFDFWMDPSLQGNQRVDDTLNEADGTHQVSEVVLTDEDRCDVGFVLPTDPKCAGGDFVKP